MAARRFLFVSIEGLSCDLAWRVKREGHEVKIYIQNEADRMIGDGFIEKSVNLENDTEWADIVVFDDVLGQGALAEDLREKGKRVVGGTRYTDRLEDDRSFGQEELRRHGIGIIPFADFTSFDEAIDYVVANPARYVIKPSGEAQNIKRLLFVGQEEDGKDIVHVLESYKRAYADTVRQFQLQRRVSGVEIGVGGFFNGRRFLQPINVNFEHKKLFPGDLGPSTGEMGTLMYWSAPNKIFNQTLKKLEQTLAEQRYTGYIDINCIVNGQGIYPLEFTARFGYPTISIQQVGLLTPMADLLRAMAEGDDLELKTKRGFQIGVRIVVPPFPFNDAHTFDALSRDRVIIFRKEPKENIHIEDVRLVNGEWLITGKSGVVMVVSGHGQTVRQAQSAVYNRIKNILIPNMYYRSDIGDRWFEDSDKLHSWGYLRDS